MSRRCEELIEGLETAMVMVGIFALTLIALALVSLP